VTRRASRVACVVAFASSVALAGCASEVATGTYTLSFQSTGEAVAVESVRVLVFDASSADAGALCTDLLSRRASQQELPAAVVELPAKSLCDLRGGSSAKGDFVVPFGTVAVLAIAQRGQTDFARGCAIQRLTSGETNVTVELSLAIDRPGLSVPLTTCTSLGQHCAGGC
jgi:hypothetical protein